MKVPGWTRRTSSRIRRLCRDLAQLRISTQTEKPEADRDGRPFSLRRRGACPAQSRPSLAPCDPGSVPVPPRRRHTKTVRPAIREPQPSQMILFLHQPACGRNIAAQMFRDQSSLFLSRRRQPCGKPDQDVCKTNRSLAKQRDLGPWHRLQSFNWNRPPSCTAFPARSRQENEDDPSNPSNPHRKFDQQKISMTRDLAKAKRCGPPDGCRAPSQPERIAPPQTDTRRSPAQGGDHRGKKVVN